ncbi:hypothetical protein P5673_032831 [Acropora cervicornis]|uniref:Uncharacterized protein n=1 Tax=Acropora cervicornis TaxID=6130 RepID=A0AAD9PQQ9_ACRCE|nr:hypothetical protein P5673_032831 [Acropora cervicornis]
MVNKKKKKSTSNVPKSVGRGGSRVTRQIVNKEVSVNESPEVNTFQSDKNGGDMESRPSLAEANVAGGPVVEHPEAPSGISRPTRTKVPSKTLNEEEVNAERAVHAKHQRAGHLGELRKRRNVVQDLITGPGVQLTEVEDAVESYDNQRDLKLQSDVLVNDWRAKRKALERLSFESGLSLKSAKSVKSYASSRYSLKERKRLMEEAKLEMQALKEKQELQPQKSLGTAQKSLGTESVVTLSSVSHTVQVAKNEESINRSTSVTPTYCMDGMITNCLSSHLPYSKTTPTACTPNSTQLPIYTHASLSPVITQSTPEIFTPSHVPHVTGLRAAATEYSPAITSLWTMPSPSRGPSL